MNPSGVYASQLSADVDRILAEQVRLVHRNTPLAQAMLVVLAALLTWSVYTPWSALPALLWLGYMLAVAGLRLFHYFRFETVVDPVTGALTAEGLSIRQRRLMLGVILAGLGWGVAPPLFLPGTPLEAQVFELLILVGVAAGAVPLLAPMLRAYVTYSALVLLPLSLTLAAFEGAIFQGLALAGVLFFFALSRSARALNQTLGEALRERFGKEAALAAMETVLNASEEANARLNSEIQRRRRVEQALLRARDMAESANRAKGEFLANMSHELRTPLNGVIGLTQLVLEGELNADQRDMLETALASAEDLLTTLSEVMEFVQLETSQRIARAESVDLLALLAGCLTRVRARAQEKGLTLDWAADPGTHATVVADPLLLAGLLDKLLDNAVKFTDRGGVMVRLAPRAEGLVLEVADTGIGMPPDKLEAVFAPFYQVDTSSTRRHGGMGLGLALARGMARILGARLSVDSELGRGSRFRLELPAHPPAPEPLDETSAADKPSDTERTE